MPYTHTVLAKWGSLEPEQRPAVSAVLASEAWVQLGELLQNTPTPTPPLDQDPLGATAVYSHSPPPTPHQDQECPLPSCPSAAAAVAAASGGAPSAPLSLQSPRSAIMMAAASAVDHSLPSLAEAAIAAAAILAHDRRPPSALASLMEPGMPEPTDLKVSRMQPCPLQQPALRGQRG